MSPRDRQGAGPTAIVDAPITSRHSIRAFLPEAMPRHSIEELLRVAARAPSGTNVQSWMVHVLTGSALSRLSNAIFAVCHDPAQLARSKVDYANYPAK